MCFSLEWQSLNSVIKKILSCLLRYSAECAIWDTFVLLVEIDNGLELYLIKDLEEGIFVLNMFKTEYYQALFWAREIFLNRV